MAFAVRWKIPFASDSGIRYRIDIYDDGFTGTPVQLEGGANPFVTDEDTNDNFFTPVRVKTGNIQVFTDIPAGGKLDLATIIPENNIARPVQLVNVSASNAIEWIGFLSCEAYSQSYTAVPEIVSLPVIGMLAAMQSMFIDKDTIEPLGSIGCLLARMINAIQFNRFSYVYFPTRSIDIFSKKINASVFFSKSETQDKEQITYKLDSVSLYDMLCMLCEFMGWVAREDNVSLYLQQIDGDGDMSRILSSLLISDDDVDPSVVTAADQVEANISTLTWMEANHQRTIAQGAHSVQVSAELEKFNVNTKIPNLPFGDLYLESFRQIGVYYVYMLASTDDDAYSNLSFYNYLANVQIGNSSVSIGQYTDSSSDLTVEYSIPYAGANSPAHDAYEDSTNPYGIYAGAFLARMQFDPYLEPDQQHQNTVDGLFVGLFGGVWQEHTVYNKPVFQMRSVQVFASFENGYINLDAQVRAFWNDVSVENPDSQTKLLVDLRLGNKVWTGSQWVDLNQHTEHFFISFDGNKFESNWNSGMGIDQVDGLLIPVDKNMSGEIVLSIYPETPKRTASSDAWRRMVYGIFFEKLDVTFIPLKNVTLSERGSNVYYQRLNTNFRSDISKEVSLASWLHNAQSPSLLFNDDGTPMQSIGYINGNQTVNRPPEIDLLKRLAAYYGAARQQLKLFVQHPTAAPLPLLKLNGIGDGKKYLPLAESRDWAEDTSTLTCFETVNNNN